MSHATGTRPDLATAREAIALACRTHGRKRGWHVVARMLGVPERRVESIVYGEPARVDPITAQAARNALARQRAAQIRAELAELEGHANEGCVLDARQQVLELAR